MLSLSVYVLIPFAMPTDGDDDKIAEMVRKAMQEANVPERDIEELSQSDLLAMFKGGYKNAYRIQNAHRTGLEKCLDPALVDIVVTALDGRRGKSSDRSPPQLYTVSAAGGEGPTSGDQW